MITAVPTITGDDCPTCRVPLTTLGEAAPWCGTCEWNLDRFPEERDVSWFWRRVRRADREAGFRSDRQLADSAGPLPIGGRGYRLLIALSIVLSLIGLALLVAGVWLIVAKHWFWPIVGGLLLIAFALTLRPRLGRLKPLIRDHYVVERGNAPILHRVIDRVAADLEAPRPDLVLIDFGWNAGTTRVGLRQTRVLFLGVRLLLALTPQQLVALIGHELGHLKYEDSRRGLLLQPAGTVFGRLARAVKPPHYSAAAAVRSQFAAMGLLLWQLVGGAAYLLLWTVHLAINVAISAQDRPIELRADLMAAQAAGTEAALEMIDILATLPNLSGYVQRHVSPGEAAVSWRRFMRAVHEREIDLLPARRQLSIRTTASVFASHPSPGRRHQWLAGQPAQRAALTVDEAAGERIEREIAPYAEFLHNRMLDRPV
jgi:Zn-dependent protease with chaperone function